MRLVLTCIAALALFVLSGCGDGEQETVKIPAEQQSYFDKTALQTVAHIQLSRDAGQTEHVLIAPEYSMNTLVTNGQVEHVTVREHGSHFKAADLGEYMSLTKTLQQMKSQSVACGQEDLTIPGRTDYYLPNLAQYSDWTATLRDKALIYSNGSNRDSYRFSDDGLLRTITHTEDGQLTFQSKFSYPDADSAAKPSSFSCKPQINGA